MGKPLGILVAVALAFALAACSDDPAITTAPTGGSATASTGSAAFPVTVTGTNGDVTIDSRPERIVSLSPTATEDLFAIGAGDQVVAVDDQSNYPGDAPTTDLSGFEPNVEAIAGYEPDLVVFATEPGDLGSSLEGLGITALQLDAAPNLDVAYDQIEQLGAATGHADESAALVEQMRSDIQGLVDEADTAIAMSFYYELDDTFYSVTSKTFIGQVYALLGLQNIADQADPDGSGYPQLSQEFIIQSNPDLIFLADTVCCGQDAATVQARPGWDQLKAVQSGAVVPLNDDIASRWGPRIVDYLEQVAAAVAKVEPTTASQPTTSY